jgi:hypothetical protein
MSVLNCVSVNVTTFAKVGGLRHAAALEVTGDLTPERRVVLGEHPGFGAVPVPGACSAGLEPVLAVDELRAAVLGPPERVALLGLRRAVRPAGVLRLLPSGHAVVPERELHLWRTAPAVLEGSALGAAASRPRGLTGRCLAFQSRRPLKAIIEALPMVKRSDARPPRGRVRQIPARLRQDPVARSPCPAMLHPANRSRPTVLLSESLCVP